MKTFLNAVLSIDQRYFIYRLSRARMVTEGNFGRLRDAGEYCKGNLTATRPQKIQ